MAAPAHPTTTAGIAVWRRASLGQTRRSEGATGIEILLVHPGGPFWAKKDEHAWSIPKGELNENESPADAAVREFNEEVGQPVPEGELVALDPFRAGKKWLHAYTVEGDIDAELVDPNDTHRSMVELVWPPRSDRKQLFPEVDRAAWFDLAEAPIKLHKGQAPLVGLLLAKLVPKGLT